MDFLQSSKPLPDGIERLLDRVVVQAEGDKTEQHYSVICRAMPGKQFIIFSSFRQVSHWYFYNAGCEKADVEEAAETLNTAFEDARDFLVNKIADMAKDDPEGACNEKMYLRMNAAKAAIKDYFTVISDKHVFAPRKNPLQLRPKKQDTPARKTTHKEKEKRAPSEGESSDGDVQKKTTRKEKEKRAPSEGESSEDLVRKKTTRKEKEKRAPSGI